MFHEFKINLRNTFIVSVVTYSAVWRGTFSFWNKLNFENYLKNSIETSCGTGNYIVNIEGQNFFKIFFFNRKLAVFEINGAIFSHNSFSRFREYRVTSAFVGVFGSIRKKDIGSAKFCRQFLFFLHNASVAFCILRHRSVASLIVTKFRPSATIWSLRFDP